MGSPRGERTLSINIGELSDLGNERGKNQARKPKCWFGLKRNSLKMNFLVFVAVVVFVSILKSGQIINKTSKANFGFNPKVLQV